MAERKRCFQALDAVEKGKRLKMETLDLFLSNSVSASRASRIADAAVAAGVTDMQELADRASGSNPVRDMRRMALKNTRWPPAYRTVITGHQLGNDDPKDCAVEMMLPHEIVYTMGLVQEPEELFAAQKDRVMERPDVRRQLRKVLPGQPSLALSLWQDGAPFNNNREHSLEMWTMSALCVPDFKFPLIAWRKSSSRAMRACSGSCSGAFERCWRAGCRPTGTTEDRGTRPTAGAVAAVARPFPRACLRS